MLQNIEHVIAFSINMGRVILTVGENHSVNWHFNPTAPGKSLDFTINIGPTGAATRSDIITALEGAGESPVMTLIDHLEEVIEFLYIASKPVDRKIPVQMTSPVYDTTEKFNAFFTMQGAWSCVARLWHNAIKTGDNNERQISIVPFQEGVPY